MIVLRARLLPQQIVAHVCRTFATEQTVKPPAPYWHAKFPDGKPRSFDEMPTVEETNFDPYKQHEIFPQWFKKYGYVVRQPVGNSIYKVHTFHFEDFETVHNGDSSYYHATGKQPQRLSHMILKDYREKNKDLYDNIGLGPGDGDYVVRIRKMILKGLDAEIDEKMEKVADDLIEIIRAKVGEEGEIDLLPWLSRWGFESLERGIDEKMEKVADDLIEIIRAKVDEESEIDLLPWLSRWGFENIGLKFLDRRLGALSEFGNEEADKMVEAASITNEMVALTTLDPVTDYLERYQKLESSEGYFYSVVKKYIEEIASQPDSKCVVKEILEHNPKDAITVTLDGFLGALQTVPLTVLMALYNVARNKDVQVQAREELIGYLPKKDSKYYSLKTNRKNIIRCIVWETLRFSPPIIGSGRIIKSDMVLGGYTVPKETNVILHFQVASRLEEFYKEPLKFNPSRFRSTDRSYVLKVFSLFSLRACIGWGFAMDTMSLILFKLLRNFEFSHDGGEIEMINRLHNEPVKPLRLKLKPLPE